MYERLQDVDFIINLNSGPYHECEKKMYHFSCSGSTQELFKIMTSFSTSWKQLICLYIIPKDGVQNVKKKKDHIKRGASFN